MTEQLREGTYASARTWVAANDGTVWHCFADARHELTVSARGVRIMKAASLSVPVEELLLDAVAELRARLEAPR